MGWGHMFTNMLTTPQEEEESKSDAKTEKALSSDKPLSIAEKM